MERRPKPVKSSIFVRLWVFNGSHRQAMEQLYREGRIRALGVSNFGRDELENLLKFAVVPPVYVQNKFSIYTPGEQRVNHDVSIMSYLKEKNIAS